VIDLARLDVAEIPRDELPAVLGRLVELEARVRLRLAEPAGVATPAAAASAVLDVDQAAAIASASKRWLLKHTRGAPFRCDLSRKQPRFDEAGLRRWLAERHRS
jgi:hypothetical protein